MWRLFWTTTIDHHSTSIDSYNLHIVFSTVQSDFSISRGYDRRLWCNMNSKMTTRPFNWKSVPCSIYRRVDTICGRPRVLIFFFFFSATPPAITTTPTCPTPQRWCSGHVVVVAVGHLFPRETVVNLFSGALHLHHVATPGPFNWPATGEKNKTEVSEDVNTRRNIRDGRRELLRFFFFFLRGEL